jgi:hypothetical protein
MALSRSSDALRSTWLRAMPRAAKPQSNSGSGTSNSQPWVLSLWPVARSVLVLLL